MLFVKKLPLILIPAIFWAVVIWQVPPPHSLTSISLWQFILFFVPLFFFLLFTLNLFFKFYLHSLAASLGIILLLILKMLDILNLISFSITLLAVILIIKSFKEPKKFTLQTKIPKLSRLEKQK